MATTVLGLKTFAASDPVDYNEINDNYNKIDNGVKTAMQGRAAYQLLDNGWFVDPVNQRGQTSYTGGVYAIDRWKIQTGTNINLMDGFIRITGDWDARQILGNKLIGTYTFAACAKVNVSGEYTQAIELYENDSSIASSMCTAVGEWKIYTCTATFTGANDIINPMVSINNRAGSVSDASIDVKWAAMYEGAYTADTLPAYVPKGYAAELAECQRYFERIGSAASNALGNAVYVGSGAKAFIFSIKYAPKRLKSPSVTFGSVGNYRVLFRDAVNASIYGASGVTAIDEIIAESQYAQFRVSISSAIDTNSWAVLQRQDGAQNAYIDISADL